MAKSGGAEGESKSSSDGVGRMGRGRVGTRRPAAKGEGEPAPQVYDPDAAPARPAPRAEAPKPAPRPEPRGDAPRPEPKPEPKPESRPEPRGEAPERPAPPMARPQAGPGERQQGGGERQQGGPGMNQGSGPGHGSGMSQGSGTSQGSGMNQGSHMNQGSGMNPGSGMSQGPGMNQGMGGGMNDRGGFRRKKKRRKGGGGFGGPGGGYPGGGGGGGGGQPSYYRPQYDGLPSDEDLEREAAELEKIAREADPKALREALSIGDLQRMSLEEVFKVAEREGLTDFHQIPKQDLIFKVLKARAAKQGLMFGDGTLEIMPDGFGFLRSPELSYLPGPDDIYVSPMHVRRYGLRRGMTVRGFIRPPTQSERYFALLRVERVNGQDPSKVHDLVNFEDLTPLHPEKRYVLETSSDEIECRIVDLVTPIGMGQRMLIVAPPRTGKTVLLQKMTKAIAKNYPAVKIIVLLVDERPEEVTDFRRNTAGGVEVVASTFDEQTSRHVQVAETVIEKAKRMVEFGEDVVILLDSITRLARAYNAETTHSGKIMTGGLDANALQRPKKFFGAARAIEKGGSLTIIGTALVDTGSKMDEVIFEEFKGTGNSELHLDRKLMDKRIYPCIDIPASGTRREELLLDRKELELVHRLRKVLADMNVVEGMELIKTRLKKVKTNAEFLMTMAMGA